MKLLHLFKVDENGFPIDTIVVEFDDLGNAITEDIENVILTPCPSSFHRPRWTGIEWTEDMSQEEIDELNKQPEKEPSEIDNKIATLEGAVMELTMILASVGGI